MPKTFRNEFEKALTYEKLMEAHKKCRECKNCRANVIKFNIKQEEYINWLYDRLKNRTYKHGGYTVFYVTEPKLRKIEASAYMDRIVHRWCYDNFLEPAFTPTFIQNTYACIKKRGMHKSALDVQKGMRECRKKYGEYYILKMDISKYFQSINKKILLEMVRKKIKDKDVLWILEKIIYSQNSEVGLPIGNLTSQIFANLYYSKADYYIKHNLKIRYYYRYMDDSIIMMEKKEDIKRVKSDLEKFIWNELRLEFNSKTNIFKSKQGVNFCGYKINENRLKLRDKGKKKLKKKVKYLKAQVKNKNMSSEEAKKYLCGHFGYMNIANVYRLKNTLFAIEE